MQSVMSRRMSPPSTLAANDAVQRWGVAECGRTALHRAPAPGGAGVNCTTSSGPPRGPVDPRVRGGVGWRVTITYDEAVAELTKPGAGFQTRTTEIRGVECTIFENVPPTLRALFADARLQGDKMFLVYEDERWSFAQVMAEVDGLAAALVERYGVEKGDRVAIGMRNYPEWVVAYAAIVSIGAVSVSLNAWWTEDEMAYGLQDSGATVLIADVERVERSRIAAERLGIRTIGVRLGPEAAPPATSTAGRTSSCAGRRCPSRHRSRRRRHDPLHVGHHRPSEGRGVHPPGRRPGAVRLRLPDRDRLAAPTDRRRGPGRPPVFILIVPLFHVTGNVAVMLSCFTAGLKLVIMHKWDPERALELIEREEVTNFVGVPTQSWDLLESPRFDDFDTSSLMSVGGGGAPAPPRLVDRVATASSGPRRTSATA